MLRKWFVLMLIVLLSACGAQETAIPASTPRPTRTLVPLPADSTAPVPTRAPTVLAAASTAAPTAVPTLAPTADPTAELCPLTGVRDSAKPWTTRRPLLVKIDNGPLARPQSGLTQADIVVEHYAEGGITRFDAAFWCSGADDVGPVRSARMIDFDLVNMFQAALAHVGASNENLAVLRQLYGNRLLDGDQVKAPYHRIAERAAPYNDYTSTQALWAAMPERGIAQTGIQLKGLTFDDAAPAAGKPAVRVNVPYDSRFSDSIWDYVSANALYKKSLLGNPFVDGKKQQVQVANVLVIFAPHTLTDIVEDSLGSRSIKIDLKGKGRAVLFRDGQAYDGQWLREDANAFIRFVDAAGKDLPLKTGRAWFEVVPTDFKLDWK